MTIPLSCLVPVNLPKICSVSPKQACDAVPDLTGVSDYSSGYDREIVDGSFRGGPFLFFWQFFLAFRGRYCWRSHVRLNCSIWCSVIGSAKVKPRSATIGRSIFSGKVNYSLTLFELQAVWCPVCQHPHLSCFQVLDGSCFYSCTFGPGRGPNNFFNVMVP